MGRQGGKCKRCGAQRRGGRRYVTGSASFTVCAKCSTPICAMHAKGEDGEWVCENDSLCQRDARRR